METGLVHESHNIQKYKASFDLNLAVNEAQTVTPEIVVSTEILTTSIKNALDESVKNIQWFKNDHFQFVVIADQKSTHLYLQDSQSNQQTQLEEEPGLVQDY